MSNKNNDCRRGMRNNDQSKAVNLPGAGFNLLHFNLNQTEFTYIQHRSSFKTLACIPEGKHYIFHLIDEDGCQVQVLGDTAIITEPFDNQNEKSKILVTDVIIVIVTFDHAALQILLKSRFGGNFSSVPWRTGITESSTHLVLIRSLVLWIIQEKAKSDLLLKSWLHIENALLELFVDNLDRRMEPRDIEKKWFVELEKWIDENLTDPIVLNDLAKIGGVSTRTIQKAFREYRGCTPVDDINRRRIEKAHGILTDADNQLSVLEVALEVGYQHPSRFAALYKKKYGENPSQTLSRIRKKIDLL